MNSLSPCRMAEYRISCSNEFTSFIGSPDPKLWVRWVSLMNPHRLTQSKVRCASSYPGSSMTLLRDAGDIFSHIIGKIFFSLSSMASTFLRLASWVPSLSFVKIFSSFFIWASLAAFFSHFLAAAAAARAAAWSAVSSSSTDSSSSSSLSDS